MGPKKTQNGQYGIHRVPRYKKNAPTPNIHEVRAICSGATAPKTQNGDLKVTAGGKIWSKTDTTLWTPSGHKECLNHVKNAKNGFFGKF